MAELPGVKTKNHQVVKVRFDHHCEKCYSDLVDYLKFVDMEIPYGSDAEFFVPLEWFMANEKIGCIHYSPLKLLKSAYVKNK